VFIVGSLRFATGLTVRETLLNALAKYVQGHIKVSFFKQNSYRKQLNTNCTNGSECACINVLFYCIKKSMLLKKNHSNHKDITNLRVLFTE